MVEFIKEVFEWDLDLDLFDLDLDLDFDFDLDLDRVNDERFLAWIWDVFFVLKNVDSAEKMLFWLVIIGWD